VLLGDSYRRLRADLDAATTAADTTNATDVTGGTAGSVLSGPQAGGR
jgi:hypothetical protein